MAGTDKSPDLMTSCISSSISTREFSSTTMNPAAMTATTATTIIRTTSDSPRSSVHLAGVPPSHWMAAGMSSSIVEERSRGNHKACFWESSPTSIREDPVGMYRHQNRVEEGRKGAAEEDCHEEEEGGTSSLSGCSGVPTRCSTLEGLMPANVAPCSSSPVNTTLSKSSASYGQFSVLCAPQRPPPRWKTAGQGRRTQLHFYRENVNATDPTTATTTDDPTTATTTTHPFLFHRRHRPVHPPEATPLPCHTEKKDAGEEEEHPSPVELPSTLPIPLSTGMSDVKHPKRRRRRQNRRNRIPVECETPSAMESCSLPCATVAVSRPHLSVHRQAEVMANGTIHQEHREEKNTTYPEGRTTSFPLSLVASPSPTLSSSKAPSYTFAAACISHGTCSTLSFPCFVSSSFSGAPPRVPPPLFLPSPVTSSTTFSEWVAGWMCAAFSVMGAKKKTDLFPSSKKTTPRITGTVLRVAPAPPTTASSSSSTDMPHLIYYSTLSDICRAPSPIHPFSPSLFPFHFSHDTEEASSPSCFVILNRTPRIPLGNERTDRHARERGEVFPAGHCKIIKLLWYPPPPERLQRRTNDHGGPTSSMPSRTRTTAPLLPRMTCTTEANIDHGKEMHVREEKGRGGIGEENHHGVWSFASHPPQGNVTEPSTTADGVSAVFPRQRFSPHHSFAFSSVSSAKGMSKYDAEPTNPMVHLTGVRQHRDTPSRREETCGKTSSTASITCTGVSSPGHGSPFIACSFDPSPSPSTALPRYSTPLWWNSGSSPPSVVVCGTICGLRRIPFLSSIKLGVQQFCSGVAGGHHQLFPQSGSQLPLCRPRKKRGQKGKEEASPVPPPCTPSTTTEAFSSSSPPSSPSSGPRFSLCATEWVDGEEGIVGAFYDVPSLYRPSSPTKTATKKNPTLGPSSPSLPSPVTKEGEAYWVIGTPHYQVMVRWNVPDEDLRAFLLPPAMKGSEEEKRSTSEENKKESGDGTTTTEAMEPRTEAAFFSRSSSSSSPSSHHSHSGVEAVVVEGCPPPTTDTAPDRVAPTADDSENEKERRRKVEVAITMALLWRKILFSLGTSPSMSSVVEKMATPDPHHDTPPMMSIPKEAPLYSEEGKEHINEVNEKSVADRQQVGTATEKKEERQETGVDRPGDMATSVVDKNGCSPEATLGPSCALLSSSASSSSIGEEDGPPEATDLVDDGFSTVKAKIYQLHREIVQRQWTLCFTMTGARGYERLILPFSPTSSSPFTAPTSTLSSDPRTSRTATITRPTSSPLSPFSVEIEPRHEAQVEKGHVNNETVTPPHALYPLLPPSREEEKAPLHRCSWKDPQASHMSASHEGMPPLLPEERGTSTAPSTVQTMATTTPGGAWGVDLSPPYFAFSAVSSPCPPSSSSFDRLSHPPHSLPSSTSLITSSPIRGQLVFTAITTEEIGMSTPSRPGGRCLPIGDATLFFQQHRLPHLPPLWLSPVTPSSSSSAALSCSVFSPPPFPVEPSPNSTAVPTSVGSIEALEEAFLSRLDCAGVMFYIHRTIPPNAYPNPTGSSSSFISSSFPSSSTTSCPPSLPCTTVVKVWKCESIAQRLERAAQEWVLTHHLSGKALEEKMKKKLKHNSGIPAPYRPLLRRWSAGRLVFFIRFSLWLFHSRQWSVSAGKSMLHAVRGTWITLQQTFEREESERRSVPTATLSSSSAISETPLHREAPPLLSALPSSLLHGNSSLAMEANGAPISSVPSAKEDATDASSRVVMTSPLGTEGTSKGFQDLASFSRCDSPLRVRRPAPRPRPPLPLFVILLAGPQGVGKSTAARALFSLLAHHGGEPHWLNQDELGTRKKYMASLGAILEQIRAQRQQVEKMWKEEVEMEGEKWKRTPTHPVEVKVKKEEEELPFSASPCGAPLGTTSSFSMEATPTHVILDKMHLTATDRNVYASLGFPSLEGPFYDSASGSGKDRRKSDGTSFSGERATDGKRSPVSTANATEEDQRRDDVLSQEEEEEKETSPSTKRLYRQRPPPLAVMLVISFFHPEGESALLESCLTRIARRQAHRSVRVVGQPLYKRETPSVPDGEALQTIPSAIATADHQAGFLQGPSCTRNQKEEERGPPHPLRSPSVGLPASDVSVSASSKKILPYNIMVRCVQMFDLNGNEKGNGKPVSVPTTSPVQEKKEEEDKKEGLPKKIPSKRNLISSPSSTTANAIPFMSSSLLSFATGPKGTRVEETKTEETCSTPPDTQEGVSDGCAAGRLSRILHLNVCASLKENVEKAWAFLCEHQQQQYAEYYQYYCAELAPARSAPESPLQRSSSLITSSSFFPLWYGRFFTTTTTSSVSLSSEAVPTGAACPRDSGEGIHTQDEEGVVVTSPTSRAPHSSDTSGSASVSLTPPPEPREGEEAEEKESITLQEAGKGRKRRWNTNAPLFSFFWRFLSGEAFLSTASYIPEAIRVAVAYETHLLPLFPCASPSLVLLEAVDAPEVWKLAHTHLASQQASSSFSVDPRQENLIADPGVTTTTRAGNGSSGQPSHGSGASVDHRCLPCLGAVEVKNGLPAISPPSCMSSDITVYSVLYKGGASPHPLLLVYFLEQQKTFVTLRLCRVVEDCRMTLIEAYPVWEEKGEEQEKKTVNESGNLMSKVPLSSCGVYTPAATPPPCMVPGFYLPQPPRTCGVRSSTCVPQHRNDVPSASLTSSSISPIQGVTTTTARPFHSSGHVDVASAPPSCPPVLLPIQWCKEKKMSHRYSTTIGTKMEDSRNRYSSLLHHANNDANPTSATKNKHPGSPIEERESYARDLYVRAVVSSPSDPFCVVRTLPPQTLAAFRYHIIAS